MPRKPNFRRRPTEPDSKYEDREVTAFINRMMKGGKKSTAAKLFYKALDEAAAKIADKQPLEVFKQAVKNVMPIVQVKAKRIGGSTYQVPIEVDPRVSIAIAHRWIIMAARRRKSKAFSSKLCEELLDAFNNSGWAVDKKIQTHKMAEANKAFAHYGKY